jgi:hypothetical protein
MKRVITGNWRKVMDYRYLSGEDLLDQDVTLTIKEVGIDDVQNDRGTEEKPCIAFEETPKMLVLNKTNARKLTAALNTPSVENWIGHKITLYCETVSAFGKQVFAVRIKDVD